MSLNFLTDESSNDAKIFKLYDVIRETSFAIHNYHKQGHLEKIYENALSSRLRKLGIKVEQQFSLKVFDEDETILGEYFADLFVEKLLDCRIKGLSKFS